MAQLKVDIVANLGPLNDLIKRFAELDQKVKDFSSQGGSNLQKVLSTLGNVRAPFDVMSNAIQQARQNLQNLQGALTNLEKVKAGKAVADLKTPEVERLNEQIKSLTSNLQKLRDDFTKFVTVIRTPPPQLLSGAAEIIRAEQLQRIQQYRKEIESLIQQEKNLIAQRQAAGPGGAGEAFTPQIEALRQQIGALSGQYTLAQAKLKKFTPGAVFDFIAPAESVISSLMSSLNLAAEKAVSHAERLTRTFASTTPAKRPPSIEAEAGRTYVQNFSSQIFEIVHNLSDSILKELTAVFQTEEGFSRGGLEAASEKLERRLMGLRKSIEKIVSSPVFFRMIDDLDRGIVPAQEKIMKLGEILNRLTRFAWNAVQEFGKEMGEPMAVAIGPTRPGLAAEQLPQLQSMLEQNLAKQKALQQIINAKEAAGVDTKYWYAQLEKLREQELQIQRSTQFIQEKGFTKLPEVLPVGREITVRPKKTVREVTGFDVDELEKTFAQMLGFEERATDEAELFQHQIRQTVSASKDLYTALMRIPELLERMRSLVVGKAAAPGMQLESLLQTAEIFEKTPKIKAPDIEAFTVIENLPTSVGKAAGYFSREISDILFQIGTETKEVAQGYAEMESWASRSLSSQIKHLEKLSQAFKGINYDQLKSQFQELIQIAHTASFEPEKALGSTAEKAKLLSQHLEILSGQILGVARESLLASEALDFRPFVEGIENLKSVWTQPEVGLKEVRRLDFEFRRVFEKFREEGGSGPINNMAAAWQKVVQFVERYASTLQKVTKEAEKSPPAIAEKRISVFKEKQAVEFQQLLQQLYGSFDIAKEPLAHINKFRDAFRTVGFYARDIFNVSANVGGIIENIRELSQITLQSITKGLDAVSAPRFSELSQGIHQATAALSQEHLPALKKVAAAYYELENITRQFAGGSFLRVPRKQLPEELISRFKARTPSEPYAFEGFALEEAINVPEAYQRYLKKFGDSFIETVEIIGRQLKETPAQAIFPGSLEIVDVVSKKMQNMIERSMTFYIDRLESGKHEIMYEPSLPYLKTLRERLGIAKEVFSYRESPEIASINLTLTRTMRALDAFIAMYERLFKVLGSGGSAAQGYKDFEKSIDAIQARFKQNFLGDLAEYSTALKKFLEDEFHAAAAVREGLKLPTSKEGVPYGLAAILQQKTETGVPFVQTLGPLGISRITLALSQELERASKIPDENISAMLQRRIFEVQKILTAERLRLQKAGQWPVGIIELARGEIQATEEPLLGAFTTLKPESLVSAKEPVIPALAAQAKSATQEVKTQAAAARTEIDQATRAIVSDVKNLSEKELWAELEKLNYTFEKLASIFKISADEVAEGSIPIQEVLEKVSRMVPDQLKKLISQLKPLQAELESSFDALAFTEKAAGLKLVKAKVESIISHAETRAKSPEEKLFEKGAAETPKSKLEGLYEQVRHILGAESLEVGAESAQVVFDKISKMTPAALTQLISKLRRLQRELQEVYASMFAGTSAEGEEYLRSTINLVKTVINTVETARQKVSSATLKGREAQIFGPESVDSVLESLKRLISAESQIPGQLDKITDAKTRALLHQSQKISEGVDKTKKEVVQGEDDLLKKFKDLDEKAFEALTGKVGAHKGSPFLKAGLTKYGDLIGVDLTNAINSILNRFAELNNQIETFGYGLSHQGKPISAYVEALGAVRSQVGKLLKELSKMGDITPTFDKLTKGQNVKSFSDLWQQFLELQRKIAQAAELYKEGRHPATDLAAGASVGGGAAMGFVNSSELIHHTGIIKEIRRLYRDLQKSADALLNVQNLTIEARQRELALLDELARKYKVVTVESKAGLAPLFAPLEPIAEAEKIARGALARAAFQSPSGKELFALGISSSTEADIRSKVLQQHEGEVVGSSVQFAKTLQGSLASIFETFRKLNREFELGIKLPKAPVSHVKDIEKLLSDLDKVEKKIASSGLTDALERRRNQIRAQLEEQAASIHRFVNDVYVKLAERRTEFEVIKFKEGFANEMDVAARKATELQFRLRSLISAAQDLSEGKASATVKIPAYMELQKTIQEARKAYFQASRDIHVDQERVLEPLKRTIQEAETAQKGMLNLWERLANSVKTTRNNLADLFIYQVRWYSSMMVFWGVFNKITELFSNIVHAQYEIERATINLREASGAVVSNYERLQKIASTAIFTGMEKWGFTARDAGEALYQLGSAGLSAREALAALNPALAMVMGTSADMQESVKTLAGLYNVLNSSMTPLDSISKAVGLSTTAEASSMASMVDQSAKFRRIADVLTMVFRDHQVEMSELNRGYQYSISSADMAGLTFEQLSAILAILNDNMIKSSRAGRGVSDILKDIAKDPYAVLASFKELALSLDLPEQRMKEVRKVLEGWTYANLRDKSVFEILGLLSRLLNATGLEISTLSRIFENFGMIGGRALVPMLKHWTEIEKEAIRLSTSASGVSEAMAERMSSTLEKQLLKVSAYFQHAFFDTFQNLHALLKGIVGTLNLMGEGATRLGESAGKGVESFIGAGFFSGFASGATQSIPLVLSLAGVFSMLHGILPRVAAFFPTLGAHIIALTGSFLAAIPVVKEFAFVQSLLLGTFPGAGLLKLVVGIGAVVASFGLMSGIYKKFFEDLDSMVSKSEASWAAYNAEVAKGVQKQREAWSQADAAMRSRDALEATLRGLKDSDKVTTELMSRFQVYATSVGMTESVEKKRFHTVGELRRALEDLNKEQEKVNQKALEASLASVTSLQLEKQYKKAMEDTAQVIRQARIEIQAELDLIENLKRSRGATPTSAEIVSRPLSEEEANKAIKDSEKKINELSRVLQIGESDIMKQAREALLAQITATIGPDIVAKARETAEGSKDGVEKATGILVEAFEKGLKVIESKAGSREALAKTLFPSLKPEEQLANYDKLIEEWKKKSEEGGSLYKKFFAKMAVEQAVPLGAETSKKALEDIHQANMKRLDEEIRSLQLQIDKNMQLLEIMKQSRVPDFREVDRIMQENRGLNERIDILRRQAIQEERVFQTKRLIAGTEKDAAKEKAINAEVERKRHETELNRLQAERRMQQEYQHLIIDWIKRTLPEIRQKQLEGVIKPGAELGVPTGRDSTTVEKVMEVLKPSKRVTQEKLQSYLDILADQVKSFGYGPKMLKLLTALMSHESSFYEGAESPMGAQGLMQVMPSNLRAFGVPEHLFKDPLQNIRAALKLISQWDAEYKLNLKNIENMSEEEFQRTAEIFLSMYNAGPRAVQRALSKGRTIPEISETQNLVSDVLKRFRKLEPLVVGTGDAVKQDIDKWILELLDKLTKPSPLGEKLPPEVVKNALMEVFKLLPTTVPGAWERISPELKARLFELARKTGVAFSDSFQLAFGEIRKLLDAGQIVPLEDVDRFFENYRKIFYTGLQKSVGEREMREQGLKWIQALLGLDINWRPENFDKTMELIFRIGEQADISRTKIYNLVTQGFTPQILKEAIRGNTEITLEYFLQMENAFKRQGKVPIAFFKAWEAAIREMLSAGEVYTDKTLEQFAKILKASPLRNLAEDARAFAQYFTLLASRKDFKTEDLQALSRYMRMFGASSDEVWKAFGEVADQQIRRIRAEWSQTGQALRGDLRDSASLGNALWWSMARGLADFASKIRDPFKMLSDTISGVMESMRSTLEEVFYDFATHQPKTMQEYLNKLSEGFARIAARNLSEMLTGGLTNMLGNVLGIPTEMLAGLKSPQQQAMDYARATATNTERTALATESIASAMGTGVPVGPIAGISSTAPTPSEAVPPAGTPTAPTPGFGLSSLISGFASPGGGIYGIPVIGQLLSVITWMFKGLGGLFGVGSLFQFQKGGPVPGTGSGDIVPALLEPGEFVLPKHFVRKMQEGGEVALDFSGLLESVGVMVEGMIEPLTEAIAPLVDPVKSKWARIGEGYYGPAFERQLAFQEYLDRAAQADIQKKTAEAFAQNQAYIQSVMSQPSPLTMALQLFKGLLGFPFGLFFNAGGIVPHYAAGGVAGPTLTTRSEAERPWLYGDPRVTPERKTIRTGSWIQDLMTIANLMTGVLGAYARTQTTKVGAKPALSSDKINAAIGMQSSKGASSISSVTPLQEALGQMEGSIPESPVYPFPDLLSSTPSIEPLFGGLVEPFFAEPFLPFEGFFANKGGLVPKWARKFQVGGEIKATLEKYFPTKGKFSSSKAGYTISGPVPQSAGGSYLPAIIFALMALLAALYGGGKSGLGSIFGQKEGPTSSTAARSSTDVKPSSTLFPFFGKESSSFGGAFQFMFAPFQWLFGGLGKIFGFQEGGLVDSLSYLNPLSWLGPSSAYAMEPVDVENILVRDWYDQLKGMVQSGRIPAGEANIYFTEAYKGLKDVTSAMDKKFLLFESIKNLKGFLVESPTGFLGFAQSNLGGVSIGLPLSNKDIRGSVANVLIHESVHTLATSSGPLGQYVLQIDPVVAFNWAKSLFPGKQNEGYLEYYSQPREVLARGVAGHLQAMIQNRPVIVEWPMEYDAMFKDIAQKMLAGEKITPPEAPSLGARMSRAWNEFWTVPKRWIPTDIYWTIAGYAKGGLIRKLFQSGGTVPGTGFNDTVPAWLTPGEFVVNKRTVEWFGPDFFHSLQEIARRQQTNSIAQVVQATQEAQKFATGGLVRSSKPASSTTAAGHVVLSSHNVTPQPAETKVTVVTVVDESSMDEFLNTKKYGDVLVNRLGSRITRRVGGHL